MYIKERGGCVCVRDIVGTWCDVGCPWRFRRTAGLEQRPWSRFDQQPRTSLPTRLCWWRTARSLSGGFLPGREESTRRFCSLSSPEHRSCWNRKYSSFLFRVGERENKAEGEGQLQENLKHLASLSSFFLSWHTCSNFFSSKADPSLLKRKSKLDKTERNGTEHVWDGGKVDAKREKTGAPYHGSNTTRGASIHRQCTFTFVQTGVSFSNDFRKTASGFGHVSVSGCQ